MSNRNDEIFEALLTVAAKEVVKREVAAMPSCEELNQLYKPSPAFEKRAYKIINRHIAAKRIRRLTRTLGRAAAVFCIFATLTTAVLMSVEASRIFILNTIIGLQDDHAVFEFINGGEPVETEGFYGRIPHGFELVSSQTANGSVMALFVNADGTRLVFSKNSADTIVFGIDTEYTEIRTAVIDGQEVYLFVTIDEFGLTSLMWRIENIVFTLDSDMSVDDLIDIAEVFWGD